MSTYAFYRGCTYSILSSRFSESEPIRVRLGTLCKIISVALDHKFWSKSGSYSFVSLNIENQSTLIGHFKKLHLRLLNIGLGSRIMFCLFREHTISKVGPTRKCNLAKNLIFTHKQKTALLTRSKYTFFV